MEISELLQVPGGSVDLSRFDTHGKPGFKGKKADGKKALARLGPTLADLQEKLYASGYAGEGHRVLLVIQGMDTSGKGGVLKHAVSLLDPGGVQIKSFKAPTKEELAHDFLWRIEKEVPAPGMVGIFDRSHYEDVLIVKVHGLADNEEIERRYRAINDFEQRLVDEGTIVIKVMLHISKDEQRERLLARLDDPTKQWKYKPGDVDERQHWDAYQRAFEVALERCNTKAAPWYVVPSDRKWYLRWAISTILIEKLDALGLDWPDPDYDIKTERKRVLST